MGKRNPDAGVRGRKPPTVGQLIRGESAPFNCKWPAVVVLSYAAAVLWLTFAFLWAAGTYPGMLAAPVLLYFGVLVAYITLPIIILDNKSVIPEPVLEGLYVACAFVPSLWVGAVAAPVTSLVVLLLLTAAAQVAVGIAASKGPERWSRKRIEGEMREWLLRSLAGGGMGFTVGWGLRHMG